jgi:hypothetical protein
LFRHPSGLYFSRMTEHVFGLTVNEVMAYAAIVNVVLVLLLAFLTTYYAWHAKRQADASHQEVAASKRQADIAQQTLDFLLRQTEQQRQIDLSTVSFNLEAAIHMVDQWQTRIRSDSYPQLPDVIELRPTNFSSSVANAEKFDSIAAAYMGAALLYISEAETNIRVKRGANPALPQSWLQPREKAANALGVARFKLDSARTRLRAFIEEEQHRAVSR